MSIRSTVKNIDSVPVLELEGEIDAYTTSIIEPELDKLINEGKTKIIVNLEKVSFIDSTGLGLLHKKALKVNTNHGALAVASVGEMTKHIMERFGLDEEIVVSDDVEKAYEAITHNV